MKLALTGSPAGIDQDEMPLVKTGYRRAQKTVLACLVCVASKTSVYYTLDASDPELPYIRRVAFN